jgi:hypothetical protein
MKSIKDWITGIAVPKLHTKDMQVVNDVNSIEEAARW